MGLFYRKIKVLFDRLVTQRPERGGSQRPVPGARAELQEVGPGEAAGARRDGNPHRQERAEDRTEED